MRQPDITPRGDSERPRKPERLSKDAINTLPLFYYEGQVEVIRTPEDAQAAASVLQNAPALGFDTETRPSFRKGKTYPPSLVQFAVPDRVYIFQLSEVSLEGPLAGILGNSGIRKVGVAVQDDCRFLTRLHPFTPAGLVDLGGLARRGGVAEQGLRGLAAHFLGLRISKGEQCSNWSVKNLTPKQIRYAATDAWVSLEVYRCMAELGFLEP
jgi:ribonuclease D